MTRAQQTNAIALSAARRTEGENLLWFIQELRNNSHQIR
jgi:hypothetical protein